MFKKKKENNPQLSESLQEPETSEYHWDYGKEIREYIATEMAGIECIKASYLPGHGVSLCIEDFKRLCSRAYYRAIGLSDDYQDITFIGYDGPLILEATVTLHDQNGKEAENYDY